MDTLMLLLLLPLAVPFVTKYFFGHTINWKEMLCQILVPVIAVTAVYYIGRYGQTADVEVWNGSVTDKRMEDGSYVRSYQCNCYTTTDSKGNTTEH